jgi:hypothetical protein
MSLLLKKADYEIEVGDFMGWRRDPDVWSADKLARIQRDVGSGLRRFYYCVPPHEWSFLRPFVSLSLASGATTVDLPDDFGGVEGRIAVTNSASGIFRPLDFENPGRVQQAYSEHPDLTGQPCLVAVRPLKSLPTGKNQKSELFVFPESDAAYTLTFQYYITPGYLLDTSMPYAYGGPEHHETILESCLAVAEERRDNVRNGLHAQAFQLRLAASVAMDRRKRPQKLGYNRDCSDDAETLMLPTYGTLGTPVTINGVAYD